MGGVRRYVDRMEVVRPPRPLPTVAASLLAVSLVASSLACGGCASGVSRIRDAGDSALDTLSRLGGSKDTGNPFIPNQVAGGDPNDPGLRGRRGGTTDERLSREEVNKLIAERRRQGDALWQSANRERNPSDAAVRFNDFAAGVPEHPRAAEAKYRQGRRHFDAGEYDAAFESLKTYMRIAPVNPHLKEVEELIYHSGIRHLQGARSGFLGGAFKNDDSGIEALNYIPTHFPAGDRADDALLALARYYQKKRDYDASVLRYKELLVRYPNSEWSFLARIGLGDVYLARDNGEPYHAGYVDRDPREKVRKEMAKRAGHVKSAGELALEQYEFFLRRIERDPGRKAEYAKHVAYVTKRVREVRTALAAKDRRIAAWYASHGQPQAARLYEQSARRWLSGEQSVGAASEFRVAPQPSTTPPASTPAIGVPPTQVPPVQVPPVQIPPSQIPPRQLPPPQPPVSIPPPATGPGSVVPPSARGPGPVVQVAPPQIQPTPVPMRPAPSHTPVPPPPPPPPLAP